MKYLWITVFLVSSALAAGQGRNQPTFAYFDVDGDGKITKTEFETMHEKRMQQLKDAGRMMRNAANAPSFSEIDTNGDGFISPDEFKTHQDDRRWGCYDNSF